MSPREGEERDLARWLGDAQGKPRGDPLLRALEELYAKEPRRGESEKAIAQLQRRLANEGPSMVYYDCLRTTPVGPVYIAVGERGVVALDFTASESTFLTRLQRRTRATPVRSQAAVAEAARQLEAYFAGQRKGFDLPMDLEGLTDFHCRVLRAAAKIPPGRVATYGEIARRIGRPRAARAVGRALGRNPVPIFIPCHRVIASDGSLGGYSGRDGVRTKVRLLHLEGADLAGAS